LNLFLNYFLIHSRKISTAAVFFTETEAQNTIKIKIFIELTILLTIIVGGISYSQTVQSPSMNTTTFAVIGDYGKTSHDTEGYVADMINGWNVDFIITTGDNSYSSFDIDDNIGQYYSDYIGNYNGSYGTGSTINRFFPIPGNHDYSDGGGINAYQSYFTLPGSDFTNSSGNGRYYDYVWNNVHFFAVNGNPPEPDGKNHPGVQSAWVEEQMTNCVQNHLHWRIVYFHYPAYSSQTYQEWSRWPYADWGVHVALSGHSHTYERIFRNGIVYFVNGVGGNNIYNCGSLVEGSQGCYDDDFGAQLVTVDETSMTFEFWSINRDAQGLPQTPLLIDTYTMVDNALPVELSSFTVKASEGTITLEWTTATETNNFSFEIQRKSKGDFTTIGFVEGHGNSNSPKQYTFIDSDIYESANYYYRLKQIDNDGTFEYSDVVTVTLDIPVLFALSQNYPNPFNPRTTIYYSVPVKVFVKINIYDVLGRKVAPLINEEKQEGRYEVTFSAANLPSGIYFYRMQAENYVDIKKMIILK